MSHKQAIPKASIVNSIATPLVLTKNTKKGKDIWYDWLDATTYNTSHRKIPTSK